MAKNTDFREFMYKGVEFKYPRLDSTYRYNVSEKRSEKCQPTASNAAYSVSWDVDQEEAKKMYADFKQHYESCGRKETFTKVFGMKKLDNGRVEFRAKRNGTSSSGKVNSPPKVIDGMKNELADLGIWGGSKGNIRVSAFPTTDSENNGGISLFIDVIQVTHAVFGGSNNLDDFDEVSTTSSGGNQPSEFDDFEVSATPAPAPAADLDDDIPF